MSIDSRRTKTSVAKASPAIIGSDANTHDHNRMHSYLLTCHNDIILSVSSSTYASAVQTADAYSSFFVSFCVPGGSVGSTRVVVRSFTLLPSTQRCTTTT